MINKKIIRITGAAIQPIAVGQSAVIAESDGSTCRTSTVANDLVGGEYSGQICFVEYNPERSSCHKVCIGVYQSDEDEIVFYERYVRDNSSL